MHQSTSYVLSVCISYFASWTADAGSDWHGALYPELQIVAFVTSSLYGNHTTSRLS